MFYKKASVIGESWILVVVQYSSWGKTDLDWAGDEIAGGRIVVQLACTRGECSPKILKQCNRHQTSATKHTVQMHLA